MINSLSDKEWLVAEHYCYLGDADGERLPRVLAESVFGSLLGRVGDSDPEVVSEQRPTVCGRRAGARRCCRCSTQEEARPPLSPS